jgi:hypothetical protein
MPLAPARRRTAGLVQGRCEASRLPKTELGFYLFAVPKSISPSLPTRRHAACQRCQTSRERAPGDSVRSVCRGTLGDRPMVSRVGRQEAGRWARVSGSGVEEVLLALATEGFQLVFVQRFDFRERAQREDGAGDRGLADDLVQARRPPLCAVVAA